MPEYHALKFPLSRTLRANGMIKPKCVPIAPDFRKVVTSQVFRLLNRGIAVGLVILARTFFRRRLARLRSDLRTLSEKGAPVSQTPEPLMLALVTAEDARFREHFGVDLYALARALYRTVNGHLEGASTIEQQLVRTITRDYEFSVRRKLREMAMGCYVSTLLSKETIAALYLRHAYYGWRMNSLDEGYARLGFTPNGLTLPQACEIVARLKYPDPRCPSQKRKLKIRRRAAHIYNLARHERL